MNVIAILLLLNVLALAAHELLEMRRHAELRLLINLLGTFIGEQNDA